MIRKYVLPLLAIVGVGIAIAMVIQGNRQPAGRSAHRPVRQGAVHFVHLRARHR